MALTENWMRASAAGQAPARSGDDPHSVQDILGPAGLAHARATAAAAARRAEAAIDISHDLRRAPEAPAQPRTTPQPEHVIDPLQHRPDQRLVQQLGQALCVKRRVLPWRRQGDTVVVLAPSIDHFRRMADALRALFGPVSLALVDDDHMDAALRRHCATHLMQDAEERTPPVESCRNWNGPRARNYGLSALFFAAAAFILWPAAAFLVLCSWAIFTLVLNTALKTAAAILYLREKPATRVAANPQPITLPTVSILVPLYKERDIATDLIRRLRRLDYPTDKLDICLIVEAPDDLTHAALRATHLPRNMRAIEVPAGTLQTKPRALNYALSFARGTIIGVYDAEDAPDTKQIRKVVTGFAQRSPQVACLQGRLDFYNTKTNWLSRCFTVEYATWFRIVLPGLQKMGLAVPLGGTTLFFRRDILEKLGGWDAHNVTEDADLGIRLARHGYRTELIDTVTEEEANARPWPWVKQRSRWLKGYAVTYAVHMRSPRQLWRDLGPRAFFGVQVLFLGTLSQFVLAPLLWSFWLIAFDLPHPLSGIMTRPLALTLMGIFLSAEALTIAISSLAVWAIGKRDLIKWVPTLHAYFPLAALAAYKGLIELASRPFYWDKTAHGIFEPTRPRWGQSLRGMPPPLPRPDADG